jgi:hypothetical protein
MMMMNIKLKMEVGRLILISKKTVNKIIKDKKNVGHRINYLKKYYFPQP